MLKNTNAFARFFPPASDAATFLQQSIDLALQEDGVDLTSNALFPASQTVTMQLLAKQDTLVVGLPLIEIIIDRCVKLGFASEAEQKELKITYHVEEGQFVPDKTVVVSFYGSARFLLKAERIILNYIMRLSGVALLTSQYVAKLANTKTTLLDTRKTTPGLRYPEKYAVLMGGARNHRYSLSDYLMPKDNHIDAAGGIAPAVAALRKAYNPCPPIEIECRTLADVTEAVAVQVDRIMLDNMDNETMIAALAQVPAAIETEISGGVSLETIGGLARLSSHGPTFISVGRLTHSAPAVDFSMKICGECHE